MAMQTDLLQCAAQSLSTDKLTCALLRPLKQCWQHSSVCFLKPASAPDAQHKDSTSLIDPCKACSKWNPSLKTSVWPWPLYCNSVPGCYWTSYSLGHLCGEQKIFFQILREFFAVRWHVEHPAVSMRELYSNNQIWTALIWYTNLYGPVKQTKHEHDE